MSANNQDPMKAVLFFSVDVINSAALKCNGSRWKQDIEAFYAEFPQRLTEKVSAENDHFGQIQPKDRKRIDLPHPKVWKYIGDEILLFTYISDYYEEVLFSIIAFRNAVLEHNADSRFSTMKIKGTVWFANVAANCCNIETSTEIDGHRITDFLGHSIDIGFRLSKYANQEKLVVSAEAAILLLRDNYLTVEDRKISIYFDGTVDLKGFEKQFPNYPILWIDLLDRTECDHTEKKASERVRPDKTLELSLIKRQIQASCITHVLRYCQEYLTIDPEKLPYPKVPGDRLFGT